MDCNQTSAFRQDAIGQAEVVAKLEEYRRKRDPKATPEPFGGGRPATSRCS